MAPYFTRLAYSTQPGHSTRLEAFKPLPLPPSDSGTCTSSGDNLRPYEAFNDDRFANVLEGLDVFLRSSTVSHHLLDCATFDKLQTLCVWPTIRRREFQHMLYRVLPDPQTVASTVADGPLTSEFQFSSEFEKDEREAAADELQAILHLLLTSENLDFIIFYFDFLSHVYRRILQWGLGEHQSGDIVRMLGQPIFGWNTYRHLECTEVLLWIILRWDKLSEQLLLGKDFNARLINGSGIGCRRGYVHCLTSIQNIIEDGTRLRS